MAAESFPGGEEEFQEQTKKAFSGKVQNYKFYLEENLLKWEEGLWTRGSIKLFPETDITNFSDIVLTTLEDFILSQTISSAISEENTKLRDENESFKCQLEEMIKMKDLEKHLLSKFILLLNEKKRKIRELVGEIEKLKEKYEPSAYQLSTDEEISDDEKEMNVTDSPIPSTSNASCNKLKTEDKIVDFDTKREMEIEEKVRVDDSRSSSPKPSTSSSFNRILESTPSKSKKLDEKQSFSIPLRRRGSIMDEELEDIVNSVVNSVPEKSTCRSAVKSRKCLFEESDEEIELKFDTQTQYQIDEDIFS
ncbi:DNA repair protein XRCC4-like [Leptopilina heterotoma]|uniref:DNA repair protein XRCC4-like n=1 Tax=Leptopilina heterotoma TaxID=63436 RepID=UPI001CA9BBE2|nr:DNA repair protein XRCC4-like [Leptopilina heterotoma]